LKPIRFQQNEDIVKKGELVTDLYFIMRGTAEMYEDRTVYVRLGAGSNFGELSKCTDVME
jgi:CRP-like cAMP-binding protein